MKLLWPIVFVLSSCVTDDPCSRKAEDYIAKGIAGKFQCDPEVVSEDVQKWVEVNKFCEDDFAKDEYLEDIPSGVWSDDGIKCYFLIEQFTNHRKVVPAEWGCHVQGKPMADLKIMEDGCGNL